MKVLAAQSAFFAARRPRKDSPHTTDAYRRDLAGITTLLCANLDRDLEELEVDDLSAHALRAAFGAFADSHAKSSVLRAWSTWNQFLTFCVSDNLLAGNPMADPQEFLESFARQTGTRLGCTFAVGFEVINF